MDKITCYEIVDCLKIYLKLDVSLTNTASLGNLQREATAVIPLTSYVWGSVKTGEVYNWLGTYKWVLH